MKRVCLLLLQAAAVVVAGCIEVEEILTSGWPEAYPGYVYTGSAGSGDGATVTADAGAEVLVGPALPVADASEPSGVPPLPAGARLITTDSGLRYYDFEEGAGDSPELTSTVRVEYVGYLKDGTIFDSNEDATFALTGVIDGFGEGISGMNVGGRRRLYIPPDLGYGAGGNQSAGIGGEDTIIFDVTLLSIENP